MSLADAIILAAGQPATIRVGVVTSSSPLKVDVQGTIFTRLGRIGAAPSVGATVLLLGQSVRGAASSGSSWVVLGQIVAG
jgi:hypothetical protein